MTSDDSLSDLWRSLGGLLRHPIQSLREVLLHLFAGDDRVEEAVLEQKLGALEALGKLLADSLLDDAGARETDERVRFGDVQIAKHGEACGDAAGGGIGHYREVGTLRVVPPGEPGRDFSKLHQRDDALHHARPAGGCDDDQWMARGERAIDGTGDGFA